MLDSNQRTASETVALMETTRARKRLKRWLIGTGLLLVVGAFILAGHQRRAAGTTHYQMQPIQWGDLLITVTIYAPISGIVLSRDVEPGQTVAASLEAPVLYTLAEDLRRMELQVDVDEADVGQVKEGQQATFSVDAYPDRTFTATITQVRFGAEETDGVVTYKTVLQVDNPDLLLRPGMTATATIIVQKIQQSLLVPNTALRFSLPQPPAAKEDKRSLLGRLMPGPPHHPSTKKPSEGAGSSMPADKLACVWVLKENQPVPVVVKPISTDGVMTAVTAPELRQGTPLVISVLTIRG